MEILDVNEFDYVCMVNNYVEEAVRKLKDANASIRLWNSRNPNKKPQKTAYINREMIAIEAHELMKKLIVKLKRESDEDLVLWAKQLELEREYIRALDKAELKEMIRDFTGKPADGVYTLEEIGDMFGLTRERVRQIEDSAKSKMKSPVNSRRLREAKYA